MKFRQRLFWFLAFIALLWIAYGWSVSGNVYSNTIQQMGTDAGRAGVAIGAGLGLTAFLCTGLPLFMFFALLAWRNGVGLRTEKRHQEMLDATRSGGAGK